MKEQLDFELFAFGVSGYGTLQEKMILEQYHSIIHPDLVVLQFCTNDFVDNTYELDLACNYQINSVRPFIDKHGKIELKKAMTSTENIFSKLKFTQFIYWQVNKIIQDFGWAHSGEEKIAQLNEAYPLYKDAISISTHLLQEIKTLMPPETQLLAFCADGWQPQLSSLEKICTETQVPFYSQHIHLLNQAQAENRSPFAQDGVHWNTIGHQLIANSLKEEIRKILAN